MPAGENPNSLKALEENRAKGQFTGDSSVKASKKAAKLRQEQASLNAALREAVTPEVAKQLSDMIVKRARSGNLKAYELIRDGLGEKPVERVMVSDVDDTTINEVEAYVHNKS